MEYTGKRNVGKNSKKIHKGKIMENESITDPFIKPELSDSDLRSMLFTQEGLISPA